MKEILNIFQKGSVFGLDDYQFSEYRFKSRLWIARSEMTEHSFLVLIQT